MHELFIALGFLLAIGLLLGSAFGLIVMLSRIVDGDLFNPFSIKKWKREWNDERAVTILTGFGYLAITAILIAIAWAGH